MRLSVIVLLFACIWQSGCTGSDLSSGGRYQQQVDSGHILQAVPVTRLSSAFLRREVAYRSNYAPGTIVVDPSSYFLYLVQPNNRARRYGVSVGKGAFGWSGRAVIGKKTDWPRWTPPPEMVLRSPGLQRYRGGMGPGEINPLGARALYLYWNGRDTLYRIHGTPEWWSIGRDESAGCIRMLNHDVIDLSARVGVGAPVVVLPRQSAL